MINWGHTLKESEGRAESRVYSNINREMSLREAIARTGSPLNVSGSNAIETTLAPDGQAFLRCDQTEIGEGLLV